MFGEMFLSTLTEKDVDELFKKGKLNAHGFSLYVKKGAWRNDGDNRSSTNVDGLHIVSVAGQTNKRYGRQAIRVGAENKSKDNLTWQRTKQV